MKCEKPPDLPQTAFFVGVRLHPVEPRAQNKTRRHFECKRVQVHHPVAVNSPPPLSAGSHHRPPVRDGYCFFSDSIQAASTGPIDFMGIVLRFPSRCKRLKHIGWPKNPPCTRVLTSVINPALRLYFDNLVSRAMVVNTSLTQPACLRYSLNQRQRLLFAVCIIARLVDLHRNCWCSIWPEQRC